MGVSFKVVDPVKDPTKTRSTKVDFINGLKCTSRRWGRCIVIKIWANQESSNLCEIQILLYGI